MSMTDIKFYVQIFLRRLPYFLVVFLFVAAAGISVAVMMPAVYRSSAMILVEPGQISEDLAQSTVEVESMQVIQIIQQRLYSRDTLLDVAKRLEVFPEATSEGEQVAEMRARLFFDARDMGDRRAPAPTIELAFEAPTPQVAADVANEFASLVLEENQRLRTGRASDTLEFFNSEVERLGVELDKISNEILEFKNDNISALPDSLEFRRAEQARVQERLTQLDREVSTLRAARARLVEVYESTGRLLETQGDLSPTEEELQKLRRELDQQLAIFSESNPRVVMLKNRVAALERRVAEENAASAATGEDAQTAPPSQLELQLRDYDTQISQIETETERLQADLAQLSETISATPVNEVRLNALERRYSSVQGQYDAAVANLASAATGERIEALSKGERFSVVQEAVASASPDRPNRKLIAAGAVAAGLFAGLGLVLLLELLNGAIRRPEDLARKFDIQAFGAVPYIRTRREMIVKRLAISAAVVTAVVILPLATYAVHVYYMPLDQLLLQVTDRAGSGAADSSL